MRNPMMILAMSLLISAAPFATAASSADAPKSDKMQAAKIVEQKGDLAMAHNSFEVAAAYYGTAARVDRSNASLYNKLGIAELQLNQRGMARRSFQQALKCDPQSNAAVNNLGAVALRDKKYKLALGYFKQALAMDESVASTHVNLAEAWIGLGELDRAMTEYARALDLDADVFSDNGGGSLIQLNSPAQRARVDYLIAKSYIKRGNLDGALDYLGRAKELHFGDLAKVYADPDFTALWKDPRLAKIVRQ
jgi:tetratricopeptide (TPR) repeat protein